MSLRCLALQLEPRSGFLRSPAAAAASCFFRRLSMLRRAFAVTPRKSHNLRAGQMLRFPAAGHAFVGVAGVGENKADFFGLAGGGARK